MDEKPSNKLLAEQSGLTIAEVGTYLTELVLQPDGGQSQLHLKAGQLSSDFMPIPGGQRITGHLARDSPGGGVEHVLRTRGRTGGSRAVDEVIDIGDAHGNLLGMGGVWALAAQKSNEKAGGPS